MCLVEGLVDRGGGVMIQQGELVNTRALFGGRECIDCLQAI